MNKSINETNKNTKKIIICDLDNTLFDTTLCAVEYIAEKHNKFLETIGSYYIRNSIGELVHRNDIEWDFSNVFPNLQKDEIDSVFLDKDFYDKLSHYMFTGADKTLKKLSEKYNVKICSICRESAIPFKRKLIKRLFPFISDENIILIPANDTGKILFDKSSVEHSYIFVDDKIECLESAKTENAICFGDYFWNRSYSGLKITNINTLDKLLKKLENK